MQAAWLPTLVVASGWIVAWPVSLGLSTTAWAPNIVAGLAAALVGWVVVATLVTGALRWVAPMVPPRRALLIAIGWPTCMLVGFAGPIVLRLSYEGAALLAAGVAAAGFLGAIALVPPDQPPPWDRVVVVTAGWAAGWLWSGSTAWPEVFYLLANQYASNFEDLLSGRFIGLAAGGVLSGLIGGVLMYLLLRPTTSFRSV